MVSQVREATTAKRMKIGPIILDMDVSIIFRVVRARM